MKKTNEKSKRKKWKRELSNQKKKKWKREATNQRKEVENDAKKNEEEIRIICWCYADPEDYTVLQTVTQEPDLVTGDYPLPST